MVKVHFIETFGKVLLSRGEGVAVLAIDPSSQLSGGSILGDKTRMEELARHPRAFVRPSPSRGHLGGVIAPLPGILTLCEAAGFQWILVETVGVGQSEVEVQSMVDHLCLLVQPGSGDELQGIKKGVLEFVDSLVVNKIDLDKKSANQTKAQLLSALKVMRGKSVPVFSLSSETGEGIDDYIQEVVKWSQETKKRDEQNVSWFRILLLHQFQKFLQAEVEVAKKIQELESALRKGELSPFEATDQFFPSS